MALHTSKNELMVVQQIGYDQSMPGGNHKNCINEQNTCHSTNSPELRYKMYLRHQKGICMLKILKWTGGVAHFVECLSSTPKALDLIPSQQCINGSFKYRPTIPTFRWRQEDRSIPRLYKEFESSWNREPVQK